MEHNLGERIKTARQERGLTQSQLSDGICTKSFISQVEKGRARPSMKTLEALADRLGMSLSDLLGPGEPTTPPAWMIEALEEIMASLDAEDYDRARHRALVALGRVYELTGDKDRALEAYRRAAGVARRP